MGANHKSKDGVMNETKDLMTGRPRQIGMVVLLALMIGLMTAGDRVLAGEVQVSLVLEGAVFRGEERGADAANMLALLRHDDDGQWDRVWGVAARYVGSYHPGVVLSGGISDEVIKRVREGEPGKLASALEWTLLMEIRGDSWTPAAGYGHYTIQLDEQLADGRLRGRYRGRLKGVTFEGTATAQVGPGRDDQVVATHEALTERPRVLFRAAELPALRERAKTAFGQAAMSRFTDAIGLGVWYQLTGNAELAEQAMEQVKAHMADTDSGTKIDRARVWGRRLEQVALTYDLCHQAWPAEFREEVGDYLLQTSDRLFYSRASFHKEINWNIGGNYFGPILFGTGMGGLALYGEPGAAPDAPLPLNPIVRIPPQAELVVGKDTPVIKLQPGQTMQEWLVAGGVKRVDQHPLAGLGGPERARPKAGDTIRDEQREASFARLDPEKGLFRGSVDMTHIAERVFFSNNYLYAVLDNPEDRWVQLHLTRDQAVSEPTMWLNGVKLTQGEVVFLARGQYAMLIEAEIGQTSQWGRIMIDPKWNELTEAEAQKQLAEARWQHEQATSMWQWAKAYHERLGGADLRKMDLFTLSRFLMYLQVRLGVGDGGYPAGDYSAMGLEGVNRYALLYRRMFGRDLSPHPDLSHVLPRSVFAMFYPEGDEKPFSEDMNGPNELVIRDYIENRDVSGSYFAIMFPLVPESLKPAMLWAWHRHTGTTPEDPTGLLDRGHAVYPFLTYPMDMKPQHPAEVLPRTWHAPHAGWFAFRNNHRGTDGFLVQLIGGSHPDAWRRKNAGSFRIMGLGHEWASGPDFRLNTFRWMENVVLLPDDEINEHVSGRVTYQRMEKDGSGAVTLDMNDVYASRNKDARGRSMHLFDAYTGLRDDRGWAETGITGFRAMAVDYSGKSGSPCMVVLVDSVRGGGQKIWTWQLGGIQMYGGEGRSLRPGQQARGLLDATTVHDHGFTITQGEARLNARFITPAKLSAEQREIVGDVWFKSNKDAGKGLKMHNNAVWAESAAGDFFVIITIGTDAPPEMKITGTGLDATVQIGEQTVRFDGEKIIIGNEKK